MQCVVPLILLVIPTLSVEVVNLDKNGDDWIQGCNVNPSYIISDLSTNDQDKINKLELVQALFRHGARIYNQGYAPQVFFPDYAEDNLPPKGDWVIHCNISTITGSQYVENSPLKFRKNYIKNEQWYSYSNCENEQSLYDTIGQMDALADIIKDAYVADSSYKNKKDNTYLFNEEDICPNNVRLVSTDYTRTIDSLYWFTQSLLELNENNKQQQDTILDMITHDKVSDPFRIDKNAKCLSEPEWTDFIERYEASTDNDEILDEFENGEFGSDVRSKYEKEGGVWARDGLTPWTIGYHYCAGIDIPVSFDLLESLDEFAWRREAAWDESENGKYKNYCYNHVGMRPAYKLLLDAINEMKNGNGPKIIAIASHGIVIRPYLWGLNIYNDRILPEIAELTTLEIYSAKENYDGIEYYFRWTRRGQFVPYPECMEIYNRDNTELCDLEIMLNKDFKDAVSIDEFNEEICPNAVSLCLCGLCDSKSMSSMLAEYE